MQKKMQQLLVGSSCRRSMLLAHFEGTQTKPSETGTDACCDNCRRFFLNVALILIIFIVSFFIVQTIGNRC